MFLQRFTQKLAHLSLLFLVGRRVVTSLAEQSTKKKKEKKAHVCFGFSEEKHEWDLAEVVNNWCLSTSAGTSMQRLEGRLAELGGGACSSPHWTHPSNLFTYFLLIKIIRSGPRFWRGERS